VCSSSKVQLSRPNPASIVAAFGVDELSLRLLDDDLTLPLSLSVWMRQEGLEASEARTRLQAFLSALSEVGGLDVATEPVPLVPRDERRALLVLTLHAAWLTVRVADLTGRSRGQVSNEALARMNETQRAGQRARARHTG
jgi:hypothetical protein